MLFSIRTGRKETPWEVVDSKAVEPVPMYYDDEDLDIVRVGETDKCGTYVFEVKHFPKDCHLRNAVFFAREQLLQEAAKTDFNVLLLESWNLTLYRRGKQYRVEVRYTGRPAHALGKIPSRRPPPFIRVLEGCQLSL
ncbi:hypothetical protein PILCRDRAFT_387780 [Piloderma croceum F 1598]|uniref:Uncharacterized protein n=1 Tax=Piloderma croceum (strain F 1598) TaxID=765440 RepID=A0A0C3C4K2_PILCF|nr:hypothetical protein PILCRDRAFT_387780 [Piloderma croceum F 1598]